MAVHCKHSHISKSIIINIVFNIQIIMINGTSISSSAILLILLDE